MDNRAEVPFRPAVAHLAGLTAQPLDPQLYTAAPGAGGCRVQGRVLVLVGGWVQGRVQGWVGGAVEDWRMEYKRFGRRGQCKECHQPALPSTCTCALPLHHRIYPCKPPPKTPQTRMQR